MYQNEYFLSISQLCVDIWLDLDDTSPLLVLKILRAGGAS